MLWIIFFGFKIYSKTQNLKKTSTFAEQKKYNGKEFSYR
ncbi:MAG: hypothetical protein RIQ59_1399 [Bacteroidota bacterium]|jgi:hypothetical protein